MITQITQVHSGRRQTLQSRLMIQNGSWVRFSSFPGGQTLMIAAVSARRLPKLSLEGAIESGLGFVSDVSGDFRDAPGCLFE